MSDKFTERAREILGPPREYARSVLESRVARALEQANIKGKIETLEAISYMWSKYAHLFGEPPHGTEKQLAALMELGGVSQLRARLAALREELDQLANPGDSAHSAQSAQNPKHVK